MVFVLVQRGGVHLNLLLGCNLHKLHHLLWIMTPHDKRQPWANCNPPCASVCVCMCVRVWVCVRAWVCAYCPLTAISNSSERLSSPVWEYQRRKYHAFRLSLWASNREAKMICKSHKCTHTLYFIVYFFLTHSHEHKVCEMNTIYFMLSPVTQHYPSL